MLSKLPAQACDSKSHTLGHDLKATLQAAPERPPRLLLPCRRAPSSAFLTGAQPCPRAPPSPVPVASGEGAAASSPSMHSRQRLGMQGGQGSGRGLPGAAGVPDAISCHTT